MHLNGRIPRLQRLVAILVGLALLIGITIAQPVLSQDDTSAPQRDSCLEQVETYANWNPIADYPIEQLEELLSTLVSQQDLNVTIANIAILYDLKLYVLADKLEEQLPAADRLAFQNEQQSWVDTRRQTLEENNTRVNGTLAPFVTASSFVDLTKDRIELLERQLELMESES